MPLHNWDDESGWDGVHHFWITHLFHWIKPRLPADYRAYVGSVPALSVAGAAERPDLAVRHWLPEPGSGSSALPSTPEDASIDEPVVETATLTLDPQTALYVTYRGRLVAAIELVSPRNKDRPSARDTYLHRYLSYLLDGAHLLLVDVHRRPVNFSFANALEQAMNVQQPLLLPPLAAAYRVGEPAATGGRLIAMWRKPLLVGQPLPTMPLPLTVSQHIQINLEETYSQAATDAYLS